ncbi:MAG: YIP1 family protein [Dehalococcoidia bacterium]|nr:YIP1 family protein [Dehalococcoidia bacterium]
MDPNVIISRLQRLAKLDTTVFDEVRDDPQELVPSLIVLAVSSILAGLGAMLFWEVVPDFSGYEDNVLNTLILGSIFLAAMYLVGVLIIYVVLAQMFKVTADVQSLIRVCSYAALPMAASVLMFIPAIYPVFALVPIVLTFVLLIYAVQSATGAESEQIVMATGVGFAVMVLVLGFIAQSTSGASVPIGAGVFGILLNF